MEIQAVKLTAGNIAAVREWVMSSGGGTAGVDIRTFGPLEKRGLVIGTLEGEMLAKIGDYVIRGVQGEFYPCHGPIFDMTYEPVVDVTASDLQHLEALHD